LHLITGTDIQRRIHTHTHTHTFGTPLAGPVMRDKVFSIQ
jgi:hypothetical protein